MAKKSSASPALSAPSGKGGAKADAKARARPEAEAGPTNAPAAGSGKRGGKSVAASTAPSVLDDAADARARASAALPRIEVGTRGMPPNPPTAPSKTLHVFANPASARDYVIQFQIPEFTCHCPLTGQPDFAHFTIDMICDQRCIELKSLKMYMWSYRDEGAFHEAVTNTILDDLVAAADPRFVRITAKWYVRGGIYTNVVVEHRQPGWVAAPRVELPAVAALAQASGLL